MRSEIEIKKRLSLLLETIDQDKDKTVVVVVAIRELEWVLGTRQDFWEPSTMS